MKLADGTIVQNLVTGNPAEQPDQQIYYPVLGIVTNVYFSKDKKNNTTVKYATSPDAAKGSRVECDVFVVQDRRITNYTLRYVPVLQRKTGLDNFSEEYPSPAAPEKMAQLFAGDIGPDQVDGDWVVVQFIGGRIEAPVITGWFPHPGNVFDAALEDNKQRILKRYQGSTFTIDDDGNIEVDTTEANALLNQKTGKRTRKDKGGSVTVNVKDNQEVKLDWGDGNFVSIKKQNGTFTVSIKDESGQHAVLGEKLLDHLNEIKSQFANFRDIEYATHTHIGNLGAPTGPVMIPPLSDFPQATSALLSANLLLKDENP